MSNETTRRLVDATRGGSGRDVGDGDAGKVAEAPPLPYQLEKIISEIVARHIRERHAPADKDAA